MKNKWFGISVYQEGEEKALKQATPQKRARASQRRVPTAPRETSKQGALETGTQLTSFLCIVQSGTPGHGMVHSWGRSGGGWLNLSRNNSTTRLRNVSPR